MTFHLHFVSKRVTQFQRSKLCLLLDIHASKKIVRRFPSHETEFRPSFNVKPRQMEMNAIERLFERCFVVHGK